MKKPLSQQTINKKYKQLGLPEETVDLLHRYFAAFANLYGIISLADAYGIVNKQNPDMITFEKLYEFSNIVERETHYYYIVDRNEMYSNAVASPETREIVADHLLDVDEEDYFVLKERQQGKPIFIPEKNELLKYEDDFYYEETPYTKALEKFFIQKRITGDRLLDVMAEIVCTVVLDIDDMIDEAFSSLENMGIELTKAEAIRFGNLFCDFANNCRIPSNRGYTPTELGKISAKTKKAPEIVLGDNITELLRSGKLSGMEFMNGIIASDLPSETKTDLLKQVSMISGGIQQKPISKNAPCPCGSGKKYKRCCGKGITDES